MPKKFRSVVMDLLREGSDRLPNLKVVWAAVSVAHEDDALTLEQCDQTQADRFDVMVEIPLKPHLPYFTQVNGQRIAEAAVTWWDGSPEDLRSRVSPKAMGRAVPGSSVSPPSSGGIMLTTHYVLGDTTTVQSIRE